jgi:hypothetical protein
MKMAYLSESTWSQASIGDIYITKCEDRVASLQLC